MGEYTIEMNFRRARKQAEELKEIAQSLRCLAEREVEESLESLSGGWSGAGADSYLTKARGLQKEIQSTAVDIQKTADSLLQAARRIYDAEMAALERAREREWQRHQ